MSILNWKEVEAALLEEAYIDIRYNYINVKYPCYGGIFYWRFLSRNFHYCYFFLTDNSIIALRRSYLVSTAEEIPYSQIKKISIKRRSIHSQYKIKIKANKKYTFILYAIDGFETPCIGSQKENVAQFLRTLESRFDLENALLF